MRTWTCELIIYFVYLECKSVMTCIMRSAEIYAHPAGSRQSNKRFLCAILMQELAELISRQLQKHSNNNLEHLTRAGRHVSSQSMASDVACNSRRIFASVVQEELALQTENICSFKYCHQRWIAVAVNLVRRSIVKYHI